VQSDASDEGEGCTLAHLAGQKEQVERLRLLQDLGVDLNADMKDGFTPAHAAAQNGQVDALRLLHHLGADMNAPTSDGFTPAHAASKSGEVMALRVLHEVGADVNASANEGLTPAHVVSQYGQVDALRVLHELGADVNEAADYGLTPAHAASLSGEAETLCVLHELGADVNAATWFGQTPLSFACAEGRAALVRTLCILGADRNFCFGVSGNPQLSSQMKVDDAFPDSSPEKTSLVRFLKRTSGYVNPLEYSAELTVEEARSWLRSEKLRDFSQGTFVNRGSPACACIESALLWSNDAADLFPASCRRRAKELILIPWRQKQLSHKIFATMILPFVIDRYS
jgi:ankyrin repeat protein